MAQKKSSSSSTPILNADQADGLPAPAAVREQAAVERLAEIEEELFQTRSTAAKTIAALEEELAWMYSHELDLRPKIESRPWARKALNAYVFAIRARRRVKRFLRK